MNKNMYSILDKQTGTYLNPIHFIVDAEAIRWFTTAVNDHSSPTNINLYPHQFVICKIGHFNDQDGKFHNDYQELVHGNAVQEEKIQYTIQDMIELIKKGGTQ